MDNSNKKGALKVYYDLRYAPITYDFTTFLICCEGVRQLEGFESLEITVQTTGFRQKTVKDYSIGIVEKEWRSKSVVTDSCSLLPTIASISTIFKDKPPPPHQLPLDYADIVAGTSRYPYCLGDLIEIHKLGANLRALEAPAQAKFLIQESIEQDYITLTLRDSVHTPLRNVDLKHWFEFYNFLKAKGHKVYVVPDFENVFQTPERVQLDWDLHIPAILDQRIRLALYEGAKMNFATGSGNAAMCVYSNAPYAIFDFLNDEVPIDMVINAQLGMPLGSSPPWATKDQAFFWEKSTFEYLKSSYEQMMGG